jgi:hypothetical protein
MSIDIDHYQDSGPVISGRGTNTTQIDNIGWMNSGAAEGFQYPIYPIIRPTAQTYVYSYDYYTFFKLSGIYAAASRPRITISGNIRTSLIGDAIGVDHNSDGLVNEDDHSVKMYYELTGTYATPDNTSLGGLIYYTDSTITLYPRLSTTGPNANLSYVKYLAANTTYYTEYLHTRLYVRGNPTSYGNVGPLTILCFNDEYESNDL